MNIPFLEKIVSIIIARVAPEQIVLFGSYARGTNTSKSDIDLLILKRGLKNGGALTDDIYLAFFDNKLSIPVDIVMLDYDRYQELKDDSAYIYKTIAAEGEVIYDAL